MAPTPVFGKSANPIKIEGRGHIMPTTLLIAPLLIFKPSTGLCLIFIPLLFIYNIFSVFCVGCNGSVNAALACNSDNEILQGDIEVGKEAKAGHNGVTHGPTHNSGSSSTGACSDASSTWEAVDEKEANPTLWVPDHAVAACMK